MAIPFRWQAHQFDDLVASSQSDQVAPYILRHLDKQGPTLEAGCGLGRFVVFMERHGFRDVLGIDISPDAVAIVNGLAPNLDVKWGNVADLPFADSSMRGIVSLGVVEHFEEGPRAALQEIYRVMMPGATAIITVPYLNLIRRLAHALRIHELVERVGGLRPSASPSAADQNVVGRSIAQLGRDRASPRRKGPSRFARWPVAGSFFEYRFRRKEFEQELIAVGLSILEVAPIDTVSGMFYEFGSLLVRSSADGRRAPTRAGRLFDWALSRAPWVHAHMLLFVVRKDDAG